MIVKDVWLFTFALETSNCFYHKLLVYYSLSHLLVFSLLHWYCLLDFVFNTDIGQFNEVKYQACIRVKLHISTNI